MLISQLSCTFMEDRDMRTGMELPRIWKPRHTPEDVDLQNRIACFLHQQHVPNAARIHADARCGTVVVSGQVPSRHAKRLCVKCCHRVAGVIKLIDNVKVKPSARRPIPQQDGLIKAAA